MASMTPPSPLDLPDMRADDFAHHVLCLERILHCSTSSMATPAATRMATLRPFASLGLILLHAQPFRLEQAARSGGRPRGLFEEFQLIGSVGRYLRGFGFR